MTKPKNTCEDMNLPYDDGLDGYLDARMHDQSLAYVAHPAA
jgi:hypothetical protein